MRTLARSNAQRIQLIEYIYNAVVFYSYRLGDFFLFVSIMNDDKSKYGLSLLLMCILNRNQPFKMNKNNNEFNRETIKNIPSKSPVSATMVVIVFNWSNADTIFVFFTCGSLILLRYFQLTIAKRTPKSKREKKHTHTKRSKSRQKNFKRIC